MRAHQHGPPCHQEPAHHRERLVLRVGEIDEGRRLVAQAAILGARHHTDDLERALVGGSGRPGRPCSPRPSARRVLPIASWPGQKLVGERLVDDDHRMGDAGVGDGEVASAQERYPQRLEVARPRRWRGARRAGRSLSTPGTLMVNSAETPPSGSPGAGGRDAGDAGKRREAASRAARRTPAPRAGWKAVPLGSTSMVPIRTLLRIEAGIDAMQVARTCAGGARRRSGRAAAIATWAATATSPFQRRPGRPCAPAWARIAALRSSALKRSAGTRADQRADEEPRCRPPSPSTRRPITGSIRAVASTGARARSGSPSRASAIPVVAPTATTAPLSSRSSRTRSRRCAPRLDRTARSAARARWRAANRLARLKAAMNRTRPRPAARKIGIAQHPLGLTDAEDDFAQRIDARGHARARALPDGSRSSPRSGLPHARARRRRRVGRPAETAGSVRPGTIESAHTGDPVVRLERNEQLGQRRVRDGPRTRVPRCRSP